MQLTLSFKVLAAAANLATLQVHVKFYVKLMRR